jgi:hypothetical protein
LDTRQEANAANATTRGTRAGFGRRARSKGAESPLC